MRSISPLSGLAPSSSDPDHRAYAHAAFPFSGASARRNGGAHSALRRLGRTPGMRDYRRNRVPGGTFFFTVNPLDRPSLFRLPLLANHAAELRFGSICRNLRLLERRQVDIGRRAWSTWVRRRGGAWPADRQARAERRRLRTPLDRRDRL